MIYNNVVVRLTTHYGTLRATPVGPAAHAFAKIANAATLAPRVLREIVDLGLTVMFDGSSADRWKAQNEWGIVPMEYHAGAEDELDPMMASHLANKAEHGT